MTEQPKSEAKHTPKPWRWGFWKFYSSTEDYVFRPASEAEANDDLILSCEEYGSRSGAGWFGGAETVLCATTTRRDGGQDATLCVSAADMALIAAAPETAAQRDDLLAACEEFTDAMSHACPDYYGMSKAACKANTAIARARETNQ